MSIRERRRERDHTTSRDLRARLVNSLPLESSFSQNGSIENTRLFVQQQSQIFRRQQRCRGTRRESGLGRTLLESAMRLMVKINVL
jgi:hypothetical protein